MTERFRITTKKGDDGTTGLLYGHRVRKDSILPEAYGTVDEAQAAVGMARAEARAQGGPAAEELAGILVAIERDLWILMGELATLPQDRSKLAQQVTQEMVDHLEAVMDDIAERFDPPTEFVLPGETRLAAALDVARTVVRRAERVSIQAAEPPSLVVPYLNRLSDLLWTLARWQEGRSLTARP